MDDEQSQAPIIDVSATSEVAVEDNEDFSKHNEGVLLRRNGRLRLDAGMAYMSDPNCSSIDKLSNDPRFGSVTKRTLERWASEDKWVERRQGFLSKWMDAATKKLGSQLMEARVSEMKQLLEIREIGMDFIRDPTVRPKSWEGAVRGVLETSTRVEALTKDISSDLMPPGSAPILEVKVDMSEGELDAAGKAILEQRRRQRLLEAQGNGNGEEIEQGQASPGDPGVVESP